MPYGDDITEAIPYPLSNPTSSPQYNNTTELYDIAIGGQPFFLNTKDETPYRRVTAKYRKDQYDTTREPGEQSLTGWWVRSQSSFHMGAGIKFFEPLQDETLRFRFKDSRGLDVWTQGQVTMLHDVDEVEVFDIAPQIVSCKYEQDALLVSSGTSLMLNYADGSFPITYSNPASPTAILSVTTDGTHYYYANQSKVFKGAISSSSAPTELYTDGSVTNAILRFVKQRLIIGRANKLYELNPNHSGGSLPAEFFKAPQSDWVWTAIAEGPQAIYVAGYCSTRSSVFKITLDTANANALGFPELMVPTVIADLPDGEIVKSFDVYLGTYAIIVTNKGVRVGITNDQADMAYGPLLFENTNCSAVAFRDRFAYIAAQIDNKPALYRIDLSMPTSTSSYIFAYATDLIAAQVGEKAYGVAFYGESDKAAFVSSDTLWAESDVDYVATGWLQTGFIRYNTLENKVYKYVYPRVNTADGGVLVRSVDQYGAEYPLATYAQGSQTGDTSVQFPQGPQEYLGFKFTLTVGDDTTDGPVLTGYQVKSLPAIPRQRMVQYPVMFYDNEMDSVNNQVGYEGRTWDRLQALENIEDAGDTIRVQDFRTGESYIGLIEEIDFINQTPTDKRFSGFGGILLVTIRKVS